MWYITGPKLAQRAARHAWQGDGKEEKISDAYARAGDQRYPLDVQDFLKLLRRKCGSVVRAWRVALDKDGGSELEFCEFVSAVRQMGSGSGQNARSLWFNLDVDQSGTLSLYDLDPIAAHALDKFRYLCTSRYGSINAAFEQLLDTSRSGVVTLENFIEAVRDLGYEPAVAEELFNWLRSRPGTLFLRKSDLHFLQKWEDAKRDKKEKAGTLHVGWINRDPSAAVEYRKMADKLAEKSGQQKMEQRVSETPFTATALAIAKATEKVQGNSARSSVDPVQTQHRPETPGKKGARVEAPATTAAIASAQETVGCYAMRLASDNENSTTKFLKYLLDRFGSLAAAWDAMEPGEVGEIRKSDFEFVVCFKLGYCRNTDARRLFEALPKKEILADGGGARRGPAASKGVKRINCCQEMKKCDGDGARLALERHYQRAKLHGHQLQLEHPVLQLVGGHAKNRRDCRWHAFGSAIIRLPSGVIGSAQFAEVRPFTSIFFRGSTWHHVVWYRICAGFFQSKLGKQDGQSSQKDGGDTVNAKKMPLRKAKPKMKAKSLGHASASVRSPFTSILARAWSITRPTSAQASISETPISKMVRKNAAKSACSDSPDSTRASDSPSESTPKADQKLVTYDPNLWYIHGNSYDLHDFVDKHPGGRFAILTGRGRDCTALFESYHPWNDKHRKVLKAHGVAPPPPDPFYEEIKEGVRKAFPGGCGSTRMRPHAFVGLSIMWCIMMWLFFVVRTPLSSLLAGCIVATVGTRFSHEGGHQQVSKNEWVNRLCLFAGFFLVGPSMCWYYQHVVSHHVSTNQDGDAEKDVDVEYIWIADKLPGWMKALSLPGIFIGTVIELGVKRAVAQRRTLIVGWELPEALRLDIAS
ncbi:DES [Symbiodinium microadriaticum]|nr:DES [Symbiodinium microadriaticum]